MPTKVQIPATSTTSTKLQAAETATKPSEYLRLQRPPSGPALLPTGLAGGAVLASHVLQLQRSRGNRAVSMLLADKAVQRNGNGNNNAGAAVPKIDMGKQGKHIPGHNNYIPGRSTVTANPADLAKFAGTGTPVGNVARGQPGFKERVDFGFPIGEYVDLGTGIGAQTSIGIIHYAKDGIHIVPARP